MITITGEALTKLIAHNKDNKTLRIKVEGGGCSGMLRVMEFIDAASIGAKDIRHVFVGLDVVIDPKSSLFLNSTMLDYSDDLNDGGFKWITPDSRTCGCGSSFSV